MATKPRSVVRVLAWAAVALGLVGSLYFNITWALPVDPVLVGVGIFMSLVLPIAVALWKAQPPVKDWWPRLERVAVMGFIAVGAGAYTLVHASMLLSDRGLSWESAWLPGMVMEALVVVAARTLAPARPAEPVKDQPERSQRKPKVQVQKPGPRAVETPTPAEPVAAPKLRADAVWVKYLPDAQALLAANPTMGRPTLCRELGVKDGVARKLLEHIGQNGRAA